MSIEEIMKGLDRIEKFLDNQVALAKLQKGDIKIQTVTHLTRQQLFDHLTDFATKEEDDKIKYHLVSCSECRYELKEVRQIKENYREHLQKVKAIEKDWGEIESGV
jgi:hypothetical protein